MEILTICTKRYKKELTHWIRNSISSNDIISGDRENEFFVQLTVTELEVKKFTDFLEMLMIVKNPVVREWPALRDAVRERLAKYDEAILKDLEAYLLTDDTIHLEGYIHFRMWKYSHAIDMLLYAMVKQELANFI